MPYPRGGGYEQRPLYFKIYRRELAEGSTDTGKGWVLLKADFGKTAAVPAGNEIQKVNFGSGDTEYAPGDVVSWVDSYALDRGVKYEYKVQSYAYITTRDITSDLSAATNHGWLMARATFGIGAYTATRDNAEQPTKNIAAALGFNFDFDTMGVEYHYTLVEERWSLETYSEGGGLVSPSQRKDETSVEFPSVEAVREHTRDFDLSEPENVRGYYKYSLYILTESQRELSEAVERLSVLGDTLVTDDIHLPVIKMFSATSGYNDKIELSWKYTPDYIYSVMYKEEGEDSEHEIQHSALVSGRYGADDVVTYSDTVAEGKKRTYILYAKNTSGGRAAAGPIEAYTSSTPAPSLGDIEYGSITVKWVDVVANSYTVSAEYQDGAVARANIIEPVTITKKDPTALEENELTHTFTNPAGYDNASVSGLPMDLTVAASITPVRTVHTLEGDEGSSYRVTEEKLGTPVTLSKTLVSRTMGPAATTVTVSQGTKTDDIEISWNKVEGATAYAIIRNRMHITGPKRASFQSTDTYIVKDTSTEAGSSATVGLVGGTISDAEKVKVAVTPAADAIPAKFTLTDSALAALPAEPSGWETSQSQISWGAPYEYLVLPLKTSDDEPQYDYSSGATDVTLAGIPLKQAKFAVGATSGYGWEVRATKGTYVAQGSNENTGVKVTWTNAWFSNGAYNLYRRAENGSWESVSKSDVSSNGIVDTTATPGTVYEYCVRPSGSPGQADTYFVFAGKVMDEVFTTEKAGVGFIMPKPSITSASRNRQKDAAGNWGVQVEWPSSHVGGQVNRMLGGYVVEVYNPNKSGPDWEVVKKFTFGEDGFTREAGKFSQVVADYTKLEVKTQYRLYFRVRAFTENGDVLSRAESWTYSDGHNGTYVKWGARALTHEEFLWCASEVMRQGIANATSWQSQSLDWVESNGGKVYSTSSSGVGMWAFVFNNLKHNFMSVAGRLCAETSGAGGLPRYVWTNLYDGENGAFGGEVYDGVNKKDYGWLNGRPYDKVFTATYYLSQDGLNALVAGKNGAGKPGEDITITGPSDMDGMYDGNIQFIDVKYEGANPNGGGYIIVEVNGTEEHLHGGFKKYTTLPGAN